MADELDLVLDLDQDGEVVSFDQNISGIFERGKRFDRFVEPKVNLLGRIELRSFFHPACVPPVFGCVPEPKDLTGVLQGLRGPTALPEQPSGTRCGSAARPRLIPALLLVFGDAKLALL
jgi:hypothetical protein